MHAVIFDCDGTLVDSEPIANRVLSECIAELGLLVPTEECMHRFVGRRLADCLAELETQLGSVFPAEFTAIYRRRMAVALRKDLRAFAGVAALLPRMNVPICVASSSTRAQIELSLKVTDLDDYFESRVFSSYDLGSWKPDPDLFLHAAGVMGISPEHCVVIEDSLPGILAGIAAGMEVFAYRPEQSSVRLPFGVRPFEHYDELYDEFVRRGYVRDAAEIVQTE